MTSDPVRYVGFAVVSDGREYQFRVSGKGPEPIERIFALWIAGSHFRPGKLSFQQGPDIASRKLHTVLAAELEGQASELRQTVSDTDIADYTTGAVGRNKSWTDEQKQASKIRPRQRQQS